MHPFSIKAEFKLGFLGGGQLARMSAYQAYRFGIQTAVYRSGSTPEPMDFVSPFVSIGAFDNEEKLIEFAKSCDVVTLENEFLDSDLLKSVRDKSGTPMYPSPETFELIENKWIEKETFRKAGIPVAPYNLIKNQADIESFGKEFGWPFVLKSSKGGYDGYGNATAHDLESALAGFHKLGGNSGRDILAEAFVPFEKELAVMIARSKSEVIAYPCVESIQQGHICKTIIAPAQIDEQLQKKAQEIALKAAEIIDGIGVFAFEFFLTQSGDIILNETAPRPHNSGHYSIEGCVTSQFENHVRAVCGMPLGSTTLRKPVAVMENILGTHKRKSISEQVFNSLSAIDAHLHLYGKLDSKLGRKMGHLTVLGNDATTTLELAKKLGNEIFI